MKQRICVVFVLIGLEGCTRPHPHPRPPAADGRDVLLRPVATSGSESPRDTTHADRKIHGAVSVGTGFGGGRNYGLGSPSSLGSGLGTGTGLGSTGLTSGGW
ncbi:hypothetical protein [Gluconobacter kanchanaburiensis]|uniref:Uncharacterized protein n=1 Tax=Gluconobacter kanchanaburiensis NBRC 103587 TaxID=1307948 RepID=A0A511B9S5_9PROT|nr:hypothetical protein [Gluconobacter kanchanaburiensis]MBF0862465.1 hypothetical protein [Gluconobacter kanchanaburiensis]GBR68589.1 hypothetical protein AA103587_0883 [Gluconobacter kanchanaburiensis NBRC 103587]GEK96413.1 hypothetical protein GKA01_16100 [Gluconobacter kanchanaburiensis NBRC 103587]